MKGFAMMALAFGSIAIAAPVVAQQVVQHTTTVHRDVSIERHDNGWHANNRHHKQRVCRTSWRHHHRVRNCYWR